MADTQLQDLAAIGTLATEDLLYIVDDPGGTPVSNKVTVASLLSDVGIPRYTYSTSAPSTPNAGDLWWDSTTGTMMVYVSDGSDAAWVELVASLNPKPMYEFLTTADVSGSVLYAVDIRPYVGKYSALKLVLYNWDHAADGDKVHLRFSIDNGSTYVGGTSYKYASKGNDDSGSNGISGQESGGGDSMKIMMDLGNDTGQIGAAEVTIFGWDTPGIYTTINSECGHMDTGADWLYSSSSGVFTVVSQVTHIQFGASSGNASGSYSIYGVTK